MKIKAGTILWWIPYNDADIQCVTVTKECNTTETTYIDLHAEGMGEFIDWWDRCFETKEQALRSYRSQLEVRLKEAKEVEKYLLEELDKVIEQLSARPTFLQENS